jgi:hypothetical protein
MGTLISYSVAFVTLMAGYLSVYASTFVGMLLLFFS